ncbi:hypothetical protein SODALDRAFT_327327 [Sodiomyces alkalinus F11]|uniref:Secreted protein n=1 Tax=Sodiomyces alkalinus (strain CBS 110278 / VKM F-3762 / F11) TaxID=1314773 RepID=A0A3N2Q8V1_SODAK|nr:hypothetical protein SODALDRAFT_327327 [Sodiomyces alkalinus F11]ROT43156.1 hypothetical protein SODALDRAFT_327327 [Sodiomyces alkalinus F11]
MCPPAPARSFVLRILLRLNFYQTLCCLCRPGSSFPGFVTAADPTSPHHTTPHPTLICGRSLTPYYILLLPPSSSGLRLCRQAGPLQYLRW